MLYSYAGIVLDVHGVAIGLRKLTEGLRQSLLLSQGLLLSSQDCFCGKMQPIKQILQECRLGHHCSD